MRSCQTKSSTSPRKLGELNENLPENLDTNAGTCKLTRSRASAIRAGELEKKQQRTWCHCCQLSQGTSRIMAVAPQSHTIQRPPTTTQFFSVEHNPDGYSSSSYQSEIFLENEAPTASVGLGFTTPCHHFFPISRFVFPLPIFPGTFSPILYQPNGQDTGTLSSVSQILSFVRAFLSECYDEKSDVCHS